VLSLSGSRNHYTQPRPAKLGALRSFRVTIRKDKEMELRTQLALKVDIVSRNWLTFFPLFVYLTCQFDISLFHGFLIVLYFHYVFSIPHTNL